VEPQTLHLTDPARRAIDSGADRPVRVHVWRADRDEAPLVVLSHGTGGAAEGLGWWAAGLRDAGFDVAAIDHHGNNYVDGYLAEGFAWWWERPRDVSFVLDHVDARGPVGACGFSLGGYTAAAVCGARISANAYAALMTGQIESPPTPEYPGVAEELAARYGEDDVRAWVDRAAADHRDPRVRAGFLLCPAVGPLVTSESLAAVEVPVGVRWAAADDITPPAGNGMRYAELIPGADGGTVGAPGAGHHGFVLPEHDDPRAKADVVAASTAFFTRTLRA
jgi:predicted dienelactone hydrolase